jgi:recombinational DNA repair protein (RecF pathway)
MEMEKLSGIILSRYKYKEDILINFLTTDGIVKIVARGAVKHKAKLRGVIELFDLVRLELIKGRSRYILVGGKLIKRPLYLRKSLEKSLFLMSLSEVTQMIVRDQDTKKVLNLWLIILRELKTLNDEQLLLFFAFALGHLFYLEGLIDQDNQQIFIRDLLNLPFKELIKKSYPNKEYLSFILAQEKFLRSEGAKFLTFRLFLGKIDK